MFVLSFFDLKKAFDSVPHFKQTCQSKLESLSLSLDCKLSTSEDSSSWCDGETSATLPVVSGVLQGSVLGPLLFLIYIDGLSRLQLCDGILILFADDIVIYRPIYNARDFLLIQNDTDTISVWIKNNRLMLNVLKCKQMILSRKQHPVAPLNVKVNGNALEIVDAYKYLGVWITSDLSWAKQIEENCKKANQKNRNTLSTILRALLYQYPEMPLCCLCMSTSGIRCNSMGPSLDQTHRTTRKKSKSLH